jgi:hypothetical protein
MRTYICKQRKHLVLRSPQQFWQQLDQETFHPKGIQEEQRWLFSDILDNLIYPLGQSPTSNISYPTIRKRLHHSTKALTPALVLLYCENPHTTLPVCLERFGELSSD